MDVTGTRIVEIDRVGKVVWKLDANDVPGNPLHAAGSGALQMNYGQCDVLQNLTG